jgi:hypothetical protein
MNTERKSKWNFWHDFNKIHIYESKAEATFKAVIITISWIGGVKLQQTPSKITREIGVAFYLFALALIMEFIIPLLQANGFIKRILPFALSSINFLLFFWTSAVLLDNPFNNIGYEYFKWGTIVSLIVIWFDVVTMYLITPGESSFLENNLKNIENNNYR